MVCGHHLHNHCLLEIVLLLASPFDLLVTFAHQQVKLKLNWFVNRHWQMPDELHCDSFLFLAQCMRYTIPFHNIKVFILRGEFYVMCIINVFHGCWCDRFSWQFQTPETPTLLFQLGPELWSWRTWTANGHIGKVASQKTVKFFLYWLICTRLVHSSMWRVYNSNSILIVF